MMDADAMREVSHISLIGEPSTMPLCRQSFHVSKDTNVSSSLLERSKPRDSQELLDESNKEDLEGDPNKEKRGWSPPPELRYMFMTVAKDTLLLKDKTSAGEGTRLAPVFPHAAILKDKKSWVLFLSPLCMNA